MNTQRDHAVESPAKKASATARPDEPSLKVQGDKILGPGKGGAKPAAAKRAAKPAKPKGKRA